MRAPEVTLDVDVHPGWRIGETLSRIAILRDVFSHIRVEAVEVMRTGHGWHVRVWTTRRWPRTLGSGRPTRVWLGDDLRRAALDARLVRRGKPPAVLFDVRRGKANVRCACRQCAPNGSVARHIAGLWHTAALPIVCGRAREMRARRIAEALR